MVWGGVSRICHILRTGLKVPAPGELEMSLVLKVILHADSREILVISE